MADLRRAARTADVRPRPGPSPAVSVRSMDPVIPAVHSGTSDGMLAIQQVAGNRAVVERLAWIRETSTGVNSGSARIRGLTLVVARDTQDEYRRVAGDITATFESGGDYGKLQTYDAGVISYGKHQATLTGGNLHKVVAEYVALSTDETATTLAGFLPRLKSKDHELAREKALLDGLRAAAKDPAMRTAQDTVFRRQYWNPAARAAKGAGITSALGHAMLYDTTVHGGAKYRLKEVRAKLGGNVGDVVNGHAITEHEFLSAFVEARIAAALRQSERDQKAGRELVEQAASETDPAKAKALRRKGERKISNGKAMFISATKTRGPTWKALVESGDLGLRGDAKGMVTLVGKNKKVRGIGSGGAEPEAASGDAAAGEPTLARPGMEPASQTAIAGLLTSILPFGGSIVGSLEGILRVAGIDGARALVGALAGAGHRDVTMLTNVAFWARHPGLTGTKLSPAQPGFRELSREWVRLRDTIVVPALQGPAAGPGPTAVQDPVTTGPEAGAEAPAGPEGDRGANAGSAVTTVGAGGTARPGASAGFVKDWAASTIDLLPPAQQTRFRGVEWGNLDFPGTKVFLKKLKPEEIEWWRQQPSVVEGEDAKAGAYFAGANQKEADALLLALAAVRPGGGERRVNLGATAVLTKEAYALAPDAFDEYIIGKLDKVPGQEKILMHAEAAPRFVAMRDAARADGVPIVIRNAYRPRANEKRAARAAGNPKAVGAFSPHSLGLAMDVRLHVKSDPLEFTETSTGNFKNMLNMLRSPVYKWIYQRGAEFGFYQYRAEPWHWEYNPKGMKDGESAFKDRFFDEAPELQANVIEAAEAAAKKKEEAAAKARARRKRP